MIPQFKLATKLAKQRRRERKEEKERKSSKVEVDLPISIEIEDMIRDTFEYKGDPDLVREDIASILTVPMDSTSTLCPAANLLASANAAPRLPDAREEYTGIHTDHLGQGDGLLRRAEGSISPQDFSLSFPVRPGAPAKGLAPGLSTADDIRGAEPAGASAADEDAFVAPSAFKETKERFQVLWLKRRAQIERAEGRHSDAMATLAQAVNVTLRGKEGHNYEEAGLSDMMDERAPEEMLSEMEEKFLPFDKTPHLAAIKVQSAYAKFHRYRCSAATFVQKHYRGQLGRKLYKRTFNLKTHCASLIQILFKHHLYHKVIPLATKLKRWYFMRVQMRDYAEKLKYYRRARRIQAYWRGNKGRARFKYINDKLQGARRTQRNWRAGNYVRGQRLFGIRLIHKLFFQSAKRIQNRYRLILAIKTTQRRLISLLVGEEERMREERAIYDETISVEVARMRFYMRSAAGALHLADARMKIKLKDAAFNDIKGDMELEELVAHKAMVTFECFDSDGSGEIDVHELHGMLRELSIPMTFAETEVLASTIDESGDGSIDFSEFLDWYTGGGEEDKEGGLGDAIFRQMLKARHFIMEQTGQILTKRAEREVLRQLTAYLSHDTRMSFRAKNPPKYQCCQCTRPFALFTDYISHFDENGCCYNTKEKALFFPDYWDHGDWTKQREVEYEVLRVHDEYPYVNFKATMAAFADLALMGDLGVQMMMQHHIESATEMFLEKLSDPRNTRKLSQFIIATVDIAEEGILPPHVAKRIARLVGAALPAEWIIEENWDLGNFEKWLQEHVDEVNKARRLQARQLPGFKQCIGETALQRHDAHTIARIYVHTLRCIQAYTEASLVGLMEFRKRRPRKTRLSDAVMIRIGREDLTSATYHETKNIILMRLKKVQAAMRHLITLSLNRQTRCAKLFNMLYIPGLCKPPDKKGEYAVVGPGEEVNDETLHKIMIAEAHIRAEAKQQARLLSRIGRSYVSRLANELWAKRFNMRRDLLEIQRCKAETQARRRAVALEVGDDGIDDGDFRGSKEERRVLSSSEVNALTDDIYSFNLYAARYGDDMVVDLPDMDALEIDRSLRIKAGDRDGILDELFAKNGKMSYAVFKKWFNSAEGQAKHWSVSRTVRNMLLRGINMALFRQFEHDARVRSFMNARKMARLDLQISAKSISMLVDVSTEETPEQAQEKARIAEAMGKTLAAQKTFDMTEKLEKRAKFTVKEAKKKVDGLEGSAEEKLAFAEMSASLFEEASRLQDQGRKAGESAEKMKELEKTSKRTRRDAAQAKAAHQNLLPAIETAKEELDAAEKKLEDLSKNLARDEKALKEATASEAAIRGDIEAKHQAEEDARNRQIAEMERSVADLQEQLAVARKEEERGEERLLFRLAEDDAEMALWFKMFTRDGRRKIATEKQLMNMAVDMVEAFGYLVPRGEHSPTYLRNCRTRQRLWAAVKSFWTGCGANVKYVAVKQADDSKAARNIESVDNPTSEVQNEAPEADHSTGGGTENKDGASAAQHELNGATVELTEQQPDREKMESHVKAIDSKTSTKMTPPVERKVTVTVHRGVEPGLESELMQAQNAQGPEDHSPGWDLAMAVLVHAFDTDCSGTFDEGEVRLLLQSIRCGLSERSLLGAFPEVMETHSDINKVVAYAVQRVAWRRGWLGPFGSEGALRIGMQPQILASIMMLVSLSRQRAREFAEKAAELKNVMLGKEVIPDEPDEHDSAAMITRAQLLAMRQMAMYETTTQARIERKTQKPLVKHWWDLDIVQLKASKEGMFRYAFQLHREWKGLLVTEVPHVVRFLVRRFGLRPTADVNTAARLMSSVTSMDTLRWLCRDEVIQLLKPMFEEPPDTMLKRAYWKMRFVRQNTKADVQVSMYARARQQAVLVALDYPNMKVAATNYRCSVLGLMAVLQSNKDKGYFRRSKERRILRGKNISVNFHDVPREATSLLLLSRGYLMEDMTKPHIADVVHVGRGQEQAELGLETVDVSQVIGQARQGAKAMTHLARIWRWLRFFSGVPLLRYYEYGTLVRTLALQENEVRAQGAVYLKEILTGVSHCIAEIEDE